MHTAHAWATTVASFMIAHQVAAKAVRDADFLTVLPVTDLPAWSWSRPC